MRLDVLQDAFQNRVLSGAPGIEAELVGVEAADFSARLAAYTAGYRLRLIEALATTYPALKALLGEDDFAEAMRGYIDSAPSRHFSIRYYGAGISSYLAGTCAPPLAQVLRDVADWEWLLAEVFDAADDEPVSIAALAEVPPQAWESVTFRFRFAVRRIVTHSNAVQWWRSVQGDCAAPNDYAGAPATEWLMWRRGIKTMYRSMDAEEAELVGAALAGASFGELCARVAESVGPADAPLRAASVLRGWFSEELLADIVVPRPAA